MQGGGGSSCRLSVRRSQEATPPAWPSWIGVQACLEVGTHARVVFKPDAQSVVAAPYAGMVPRVLVSMGQTVRPGQPLASFLSPQLFEASRALTEANSQARLVQQSLARDKALYDDGIIAASRWQATQARAVEANAMAKARRAELASAGIAFTGSGGDAQLVASRGGVVSEVNAVPGARVDAAAPLFRIVDPAALELDLLVGRDVPVPAPGDRIEIAQRGAGGTVIGVAPSATARQECACAHRWSAVATCMPVKVSTSR